MRTAVIEFRRRGFGVGGWMARVRTVDGIGMWCPMSLDGSRMILGAPITENEHPAGQAVSGCVVLNASLGDSTENPFEEAARDIKRVQDDLEKERAKVRAYRSVIRMALGRRRRR